MTRRPLARAITASLWPWTEGRFEVWWLGSCQDAGHDEWTDGSLAYRWTLVPA